MPASPPTRGMSREARFSRANGHEQMTGTPNQIEWAEQIKVKAGAEFDRVANALESAAARQAGRKQMDTRAVIAILEEKHAGVMARDEAGYFIQEWQELRDQVRQLIAKDFRRQSRPKIQT